eukprot:4626969-Lingulodinium_polyedra.AAC.1
MRGFCHIGPKAPQNRQIVRAELKGHVPGLGSAPKRQCHQHGEGLSQTVLKAGSPREAPKRE